MREELFNKVGRRFTDEQFEDLCFDFGLELEMGDGVEMAMARIDKDGNNVDMKDVFVYKIEVPANRYDLLCLEGIAAAIEQYLNIRDLPKYTKLTPKKYE